MEKRFWTMKEAMELLKIDEGFIATLRREEVIEFCRHEGGSEELLSRDDMKRLRLARTLLEDLDVNIPGVEVALQMRENMIEMRKQFDEILQCLVEEFGIILNRAINNE